MNSGPIPHPRRMFFRTGALICAIFFSVASWVSRSGEETAARQQLEMLEAWELAGTFLSNDAKRRFAGMEGTEGAEARESVLGEAISLLNVQPRTARNIAAATALLENLIEENPDDEAGIFARFFLARLLQFHAAEPDLERSRAIYRELFESGTGHPLAEFAGAVLVLSLLAEAEDPDARERIITEFEARIPELRTPAARRDLHLMLAHELNREDALPERALRHYLAADGYGIPRRQDEVQVWTRIGALAAQQGQKELAVEYFGKVVENYRRHDNYHTVLQWLRELEGGGNPSAGGAR